MKHTTLLLLFLVSLVANANNEIYLEQTGNTGLFNITQIGSGNKVGDSTNISTIAGDDSFFNISQIGSGNILDIDWIGSDAFFNLYVEGNGNYQNIFVAGDGNAFDNIVLGDGNSITIAKDDLSGEKSAISSHFVKNFITGSINTVNLYLNDNINAFSDINILGNSNTVNSIQEGGNLGLGHAQTIQIHGDGNNFNVAQSGGAYQTIQLTHYGSGSTFNIVQSDGSYTGGLEGLGTISNFDGVYYTQTFTTPVFAVQP